MRIYTAYSESHSSLFTDYFLATLPISLELHTKKIPQICVSANFYEAEWSDICFEKVLYFKQICEQEMGNIFIVSDVDVQFFSDPVDQLLYELRDFDIAGQDDIHAMCSGFFVCRANESTLKMFTSMADNYRLEDQTSLNDNLHMVKHKRLSHRFFNVAHYLNGTWDNRDFDIPKDIIIHHANWTVGVQNKIELLKLVRSKYDLLRG